MFDLDLWREIVQSINKNRTRSLLSGFTVAFAILLFTILFGIANGLKNTFKTVFIDEADNAIFFKTGKTAKASKGLQAGRRIQFKNEDFNYVKNEFFEDIEFITASVNRNVTASYKAEQSTYDLRGVHPDNQYLEKTKIKEGRYINFNDMQNQSKIVVIGRLVERDLFHKTTAIGKHINLSGIPYKVVGVFLDDGGDNEERKIYTPLSTAQYLYGNNDNINQINFTYNPNLSFDEAISLGKSVTKKLKERFDIDESDQSAIRMWNTAEGTKKIDVMTSSLTVIILVIGLGTLIAGIVGISNIMIFIVKERTKEIGIRKALGASPRSIISIILIESMVITAIAGYVGLLIGVIVLKLVGPSLKSYFITDPGVDNALVFGATLTLIIAGAIAGYLPAKRASQIKPIVALRND